MDQCRRCGGPLEPGGECPACGTAGGATHSFLPIGEDGTVDEVLSQSPGKPVLVVRKGPQVGERFFVDRARLSVGRDPASDIFLNDMTVSRSHAVLNYDDGAVFVHDDGSLNGTYVNGACVDSARLCNGDLLQIGTFQMIFLEGVAE